MSEKPGHTSHFTLQTSHFDSGDADPRVGAAMSARAPDALAAALLEHADLRAARLAVDDADDLHVGDERRAGEDFAAVLFDEQHLIDRDLRARLGLDPIHGDDGARGDLHLPAAGLDDCEHGCTPKPRPTGTRTPPDTNH